MIASHDEQKSEMREMHKLRCPTWTHICTLLPQSRDTHLYKVTTVTTRVIPPIQSAFKGLQVEYVIAFYY